jgi:hypothetical protein
MTNHEHVRNKIPGIRAHFISHQAARLALIGRDYAGQADPGTLDTSRRHVL